jgi:hypothetical protein
MFSKQDTVELAKSYYNALMTQKFGDASMFASLLNLKGDVNFLNELLTVKGFKEVFVESLPPEQREIGFLKNIK